MAPLVLAPLVLAPLVLAVVVVTATRVSVVVTVDGLAIVLAVVVVVVAVVVVALESVPPRMKKDRSVGAVLVVPSRTDRLLLGSVAARPLEAPRPDKSRIRGNGSRLDRKARLRKGEALVGRGVRGALSIAVRA